MNLSDIWTCVKRAVFSEKLHLTIRTSWTGYVNKQMANNFSLRRTIFTDKSTIGELWVDGSRMCFTLEDTCRAAGVKVAGQTAIPPGRYQIKIDFSNRFQVEMPHVLMEDGSEIPQFSGIRIHRGNTDADTKGCILVGLEKGTDAIYRSKDAYEHFFPELRKRLVNGRVYLEISGGRSDEHRRST